ncbi:hypothetical protein BKA62DRAFT_771750 [Auriculariales sp. MPI-PUGE-AT-0066]|nr:hypothetical protein BKA62DRAFT_771750 [Auriculariales sp. MPI-PUGE-AT-0066]
MSTVSQQQPHPQHLLQEQARPVLPPELLREVLEWAVRMNIERRRRWTSSLMLISQVVRIWLLPPIYTVVVLRCSPSPPFCLAWTFLTGLALNPKSTVRNYVKHIVLLPINAQLAKGDQRSHSHSLPEACSPSASATVVPQEPWDIDTLVADTSTIRLFAQNSVIRPRRVFCLSVFPHLWPEDCLAFRTVTQVRYTESYMGTAGSGWDMKASSWSWTMACLPMLRDALLEVHLRSDCTKEQLVDLALHMFGYFPMARAVLSSAYRGPLLFPEVACPQNAIAEAVELMQDAAAERIVVAQTLGEEDAALQFARQIWDQLDPWNLAIGHYQS